MYHQHFRAGDTGAAEGAMAPPLFCVAKRKKADKGKKERVSKQKLLKGCHQGQNIIVLVVLERLEFENFSCPPTMVADNTFQCSMDLHFEIHFACPAFTILVLLLLLDWQFSLLYLRINRKPIIYMYHLEILMQHLMHSCAYSMFISLFCNSNHFFFR